MDSETLFPMSTVNEKEKETKELSEQQLVRTVKEFSETMRETIQKGVLYVKSGLFGKKVGLDNYIDNIMEDPELYSYLFTLIVNHSLGVKKNFSHHFNLTHSTLKPST
jgi:hypothetical protein